MKTTACRRTFLCLLLSVLVLAAPIQAAFSCTRAVYFGKEGQTVTGRTMDWLEDMQSNLWVFPARHGPRRRARRARSLKWTSKYGSVIASVYEGGTADGMNEKRPRRQPALPRRVGVHAR